MLSFFSQNKPLFWSADITKLDLQEHKQYIIHQVLQYGDLEAIRSLKTLYFQEDIQHTFLYHPRKTYQPQTLAFITTYILGVTKPIDTSRYVSTFS